MNCDLCGNGIIQTKTETYLFKSKLVGMVPVPNVKFEECHRCQTCSFSSEESKKIIDHVRMVEHEELMNLPAKDLVSANEAADILGVSKQAFSKNKKIQRGFVLCVEISGRVFYSKRSLELFSHTGDGRFQLSSSSTYDLQYDEEPVVPPVAQEHVEYITQGSWGNDEGYWMTGWNQDARETN